MPGDQPIFQDLKVSVICQPNSEGELLTRELQRTRAQVSVSWPQRERLPEGFDVVYCEYFPGLVHTLPWAPGEASSALVVVLFPDAPYDLKAVCDCSPDAVLHSPFAPREVTTSLVIARDRFQYIKRLQKRIDRLDGGRCHSPGAVGFFPNQTAFALGHGPPVDARLAVLRPQLLRLAADVICLQEVNGQAVAGRDARNLRALDRLLADTPFADYHRAATGGDHGPFDVHNLKHELPESPLVAKLRQCFCCLPSN